MLNYYSNKKCHSNVTNSPKGIGLALDLIEDIICYKEDMLRIQKKI